MKKINLLLLFCIIALLAKSQPVILLSETFESGALNSLISIQSTGTFNAAPGIKDKTEFSGTKAYGFGTSSCISNCFDSYKTTLTITFPTPAYVDTIKWDEMELNGNWGTAGYVLADATTITGEFFIGASPVNSGTADATPRHQVCAIKKKVSSLTIVVTDITNSSELFIDNLVVLKNSATSAIDSEASSKMNDIALSPNPANNILFLQGLNSKANISIYDMSGRIVAQKQNIENNVDISNIQQGIFFIKIETEKGQITKKFIKQ